MTPRFAMQSWIYILASVSHYFKIQVIQSELEVLKLGGGGVCVPKFKLFHIIQF